MEENNGFNIEIEHFRGPLQVLLEMIKDNKFDIYDIPIAVILEKYLSYLDGLTKIEITPAAEFLEMAAILLRIKSRMLLPRPEDNEEEDPRNTLVFALLEYQKITSAVERLEFLREHAASKAFHPGNDEYKDITSGKSINQVGISDLIDAFRRIMSEKNEVSAITFHEVQLEIESVEEQIEFIKGRIRKENEIFLSELFKEKRKLQVAVVIIIAVLELIKRQKITFYQSSNFGEIILKKK